MPPVHGSTFPLSGNVKNYHAIVIAVLAFFGESFILSRSCFRKWMMMVFFGHDFVRKVL